MKWDIKKKIISFVTAIALLADSSFYFQIVNSQSNKHSSGFSCAYDISKEYNKNNGVAEPYLNYFLTYDTKLKNFFTNDEQNLMDISLNDLRNNGPKGRCTYRFDGDIDRIYNQIVQNTEEYLADVNSCTSIFSDTNDKYSMYAKIVSKAFKDYLEELYKEDADSVNSVFHKLETLKIYYRDSYEEEKGVLAFYKASSNSIVILMNPFKDADIFFEVNRLGETVKKIILKITKGAFKDLFSDSLFEDKYIKNELILTMLHELEHMRQKNCSCYDGVYPEGINSADDYIDSTISFISEAEAESFLINSNSLLENCKDKEYYNYAYPLYRSKESLLFLMSMFRNAINYYDAMEDGSRSLLYLSLGAREKKDVTDIFNIIYYIDMHDFRNYGFLDYNDASDIEDLISKTGINYYAEIYRRFLSDLIFYNSNKKSFMRREEIVCKTFGFDSDNNISYDLSFHDVCLLYTLARELVISSANYTSSNYDESDKSHEITKKLTPSSKNLNKEFLEIFLELDGTFKDYLCETYDLDVVELAEILINARKEIEEWYIYNSGDKDAIDNPSYIRLSSAFPKIDWILKNIKPSIYKADVIITSNIDLAYFNQIKERIS